MSAPDRTRELDLERIEHELLEQERQLRRRSARGAGRAACRRSPAPSQSTLIAAAPPARVLARDACTSPGCAARISPALGLRSLISAITRGAPAAAARSCATARAPRSSAAAVDAASQRRASRAMRVPPRVLAPLALEDRLQVVGHRALFTAAARPRTRPSARACSRAAPESIAPGGARPRLRAASSPRPPRTARPRR